MAVMLDSKLSAQKKHVVAVALAELDDLDTTAKRVNAMLEIKRAGNGRIKKSLFLTEFVLLARFHFVPSSVRLAACTIEQLFSCLCTEDYEYMCDRTIVNIYNRQQCIMADTQVVRVSLVEAAVRTLAAGAELFWKYKFTQRTIT